ncbi:MAG: LysM peptidoglycan-binding domain-containing protein [Rhodobacteraceae bacterium]|nr:LysM peptidoglycan-binding domain-containing protein [Paracoccaceae bacterium]
MAGETQRAGAVSARALVGAGAVVAALAAGLFALGARDASQPAPATSADAVPEPDAPADRAPTPAAVAAPETDAPGTDTPGADVADTAAPDTDADTAAETGTTAADAPPPFPAPQFDVVRAAPDGTTIVAGTAAAESTITVLVNGNDAESGMVDGNGSFVVFLLLDPSPDARVLTLRARSGDRVAFSQSDIILAPTPSVIADAPSETPDPAPADPPVVAEAAPAEPAPSGESEPAEPLQMAQAAPAAAPAEENDAPTVAVAPAPPAKPTPEPSSGQVSEPATPTPAPEPAAPEPTTRTATLIAPDTGATPPVPSAAAGRSPDPAPGATAIPAPAGQNIVTASPAPAPQTTPAPAADTQVTTAQPDAGSGAAQPAVPPEPADAGAVPQGLRTAVADVVATPADDATPRPDEGPGAAPQVSGTAPDAPAVAAAATPQADLPQQRPTTASPTVAAAGTAIATPAPADPAPEALSAVIAPPQSAAQTPAPAVPGVAPAPLAVLRADADGVELLQAPRAAPVELVSGIALDTISYDDAGAVLLSGRSQPHSGIRVYLDNRAIAELSADRNGRWRGGLPEIIAGVYRMRLDEVGREGAVLSRLETPFQRAAPETLAALRQNRAADAPPIQSVTVQTGDTLWAISRDRYGAGVLYVRVFEANRETIRDPDLIYPGQIFALPN